MTVSNASLTVAQNVYTEDVPEIQHRLLFVISELAFRNQASTSERQRRWQIRRGVRLVRTPTTRPTRRRTRTRRRRPPKASDGVRVGASREVVVEASLNHPFSDPPNVVATTKCSRPLASPFRGTTPAIGIADRGVLPNARGCPQYGTRRILPPYSLHHKGVSLGTLASSSGSATRPGTVAEGAGESCAVQGRWLGRSDSGGAAGHNATE